jgi:hypothetical protein
MAIAGPELPIPRELEVGGALGGFYAISERHFGAFLESLNERGCQTILPALQRALDALRAMPQRLSPTAGP